MPRSRARLARKLIVASVASCFTLVLIEGICRLSFDPMDYLKPRRVSHTILGETLLPHSGAHDAWGFRNASVPEKADIVAIGDSQTYGVRATARSSWPASLQAISGWSVYSMALGGYGPAQYLYLLETRALALAPELVVVGIYYGNDLMDTYADVYERDHWKELRASGFAPPARDRARDTFAETPLVKSVKTWFASHSVAYGVLLSSALGDRIRQTEELLEDVPIVMIEDGARGIRTGLTPRDRLRVLDLADASVREGLRLSLEMIRRMKAVSEQRGTDLLVLLIPTKESVFTAWIEGDPSLPDHDVLEELLRNEREVDRLVKADLEAHDIDYVDALLPLQRAIEQEQVYPANYDGHPNAAGYRAIARSVHEHLAASRQD